MRVRFHALSICLLLGACTDQQPPSSEADSGDGLGAEDGSTAGCTIAGGTCVPYSQACPLPQQNTVLCGSTVLLCCLPAVSPPPGGGVQPEAAAGAGSTDGPSETTGEDDASE